MEKEESYQNIINYHERTKHHYHRYANALGYLDWDSQPDPFRGFQGAKEIELPLLKQNPEGGYLHLYQREKVVTQPIHLENIGGFLEHSLGLSAWKGVEEQRWSLRVCK